MEIGSKRAELGIRDMVGWQNGRNAILTGTGKRMVPNTGPEEERRKEVVKEEITDRAANGFHVPLDLRSHWTF